MFGWQAPSCAAALVVHDGMDPGRGHGGWATVGQTGGQGAGQTVGQTGGQGAGIVQLRDRPSNNGITHRVPVGRQPLCARNWHHDGPGTDGEDTLDFRGRTRDWTLIGAVAANGGYDVAGIASAGEDQVFSYTSAGNYNATVIGAVSGTVNAATNRNGVSH